MTEPRRPEPVMRWTERLRERLTAAYEGRGSRLGTVRLGLPNDERAVDNGGGDVDPAGATARTLRLARPGMFSALIAIGSALLALGGLWAWQTWADRSAPPVDDLLPILASGTIDSSSGLTDPTPAGSTGSGDDRPTAIVAGPTAGRSAVETAGADRLDPSAAVAHIIVHVSGAVASPGIVTLDRGARVYEAIDLAAGVTPDADLDRVNLAAPVADGERIHVPAIGEEVPSVVPSMPRPGDPVAEDVADPLIDINRASESDLEELPGVGPAIARAIVQTRQDRGPFLDLDELLDVPGIGAAKLALLRPFAVVGQ